MNKINKTINRKFIGLILFFNSLLLIITGLVLYIMPHGRIAYWINWKFLSLNKDQWSSIHIITAILFIVAVLFHIMLNWKAFLSYFFSKEKSSLLRSPLIVSILITFLAVILAIYNLPPAKQIITLENLVKKSWETKTNIPPIPHAEKLPLAKLCKFAGISPKDALELLHQQGWKVDSVKEKVKKIAIINHHSPRDLWLIINKKTNDTLESTP